MGRGSKQIFFQRHTDDEQVQKNELKITNHQGNTNQNHKPVRMALNKKTRNNNFL